MKSKKTHSTTQETSQTVSGNHHDEVAKKAYELYEKNGRQEGRDLEYWLEAEKSLSPSPAKLVEPLSPMEFAESQQPHAHNGQHTLENTRKNSANRDEIRQLTSHARSAPRQSQRPQTHSA